MALQQPRHGEHRADAHFVRLAARHDKAAEGAQRGQVGALGIARLHQHAGTGAVGKLRRIARGHEPVRALHRREPGQRIERAAGAVAVVGAHRDFLQARFAALLVGHRHGGRDGHDLVGIAAGALRGLGALLAAQRKAVLVFAADAVA
ncbi:hypothetical protein D3C72_1273630 [compost metagenome]